MTDLHCHILPGMDDGAKDTAVSLELLRREYEDGVRNIAFTSHFNSERTTVEAFTAKRQAAFEQLTAALEGQPMQFDFKLGAEVFFSPGLCELDTRALCMGDTAYLLLEFPTTHKPHFIRQTLYNLQQQGIVPLIAHIERYPYVLEDPTLLYDWVAAGAYAQINAGALLEPKLCKKLCKFIQWGLVHVISTDTHSPDKRPPRMAQGVQQLEKLLAEKDAIATEAFRSYLALRENNYKFPNCTAYTMQSSLFVPLNSAYNAIQVFSCTNCDFSDPDAFTSTFDLYMAFCAVYGSVFQDITSFSQEFYRVNVEKLEKTRKRIGGQNNRGFYGVKLHA